MGNNVTNYNFKSHKKSPAARRKRILRIFAIVFALLMIFGVASSIFYYL